jgi:hypothetical protein
MLFRLSLTAPRLGVFDPEPELLQATRVQLIDGALAVCSVYTLCAYSLAPHLETPTDMLFNRTAATKFFAPSGLEGQDSVRGRISLWLSQGAKKNILLFLWTWRPLRLRASHRFSEADS